MIVEIFKTSIADKMLADVVIQRLQDYFPFAKINVDVEDCDRILRVEDTSVSVIDVMRITKELGYTCDVLM